MGVYAPLLVAYLYIRLPVNVNDHILKAVSSVVLVPWAKSQDFAQRACVGEMIQHLFTVLHCA